MSKDAASEAGGLATAPAPRPVPSLRSRVSRLIEPHILFPLLSAVVLGIIWRGTFNLIQVERAGAQAAARATTLELANTYEAQVVRALREIDQSLKLVKYAYETRGAAATLADLRARALLPPELVFAVEVIDADGRVLATTHAADFTASADQAALRGLRGIDTLWTDAPRKDLSSNEWTEHFGRRLNAADGALAGAVLLAVDAEYFVSGYDTARLGTQGMLGLLGTDGVFRARRTGDTFSAGDSVDYAATVPHTDDSEPTLALTTNGWDGVPRYTGTQQLFEYPFAVIVGLSQTEQLSAARSSASAYLWRAALGSAAVLLFAFLLGRLSWQLHRSREREDAAKVEHAVQVEYRAYHDALTGLPNRSLFTRLLGQAIEAAQRHQRQLAVAFIDLDRFKQINDTLGHNAGDELLREMARRLTACLRRGDSVARLGGDEFVVLMNELTDASDAAAVGKKIVAALAKPLTLHGREFGVTGSVGISIYPGDGLDEQTLTKNADIAMYHAKQEGKNNFQFYSSKLNKNTLERLNLEVGLRHALERGEFELHYQAKRDLARGEVTGAEVLLRWRHPELGLVAPMKFIPIAEETGLIVTIGQRILQTACRQNVAWQAQGLPPLRISVNLSARQFLDEHLAAHIGASLQASGMAAELLELEIDESVLIRDIARSLSILRQLKAMGVKIAIDGFGTAYSSLSTLQQFPLDTVKIDRSFIRGLGTGDDNRSLTEAIINMARTLSRTVVAQGVETQEEAEFLRGHACDELQGFYFGTPMPAPQFTALLQAERAGRSPSGAPPALGAAGAVAEPAARPVAASVGRRRA